MLCPKMFDKINSNIKNEQKIIVTVGTTCEFTIINQEFH